MRKERTRQDYKDAATRGAAAGAADLLQGGDAGKRTSDDS